MCDPGACGSVMPYELYELLDLGPLKKSNEVFTMVDTSIVAVAGIAENVLVKIGKLTIPADFHVIRATKGDKGGRPQIEEEKELRNTPPQVKKKKRKELEKSVKKKRKHEEGNLNKKFEEDKVRKKIELKCTNVDDLVSKLKAFKGALHNNTSLETHLVQDQSKWK
ncbi:hypothetical protein PIB30_075000 [Stylosanthes scabra]|uniref:Uncharacterized protein n=1 Tax=Stylosanthes scabra TaxID=79078 RepID=A0ABU6XPI6_9FABA|nr:hypothetical protein [Stylosanthes scabra]